MGKRVAILFVRHLLEAVRQRRIELAESEPYWLSPEQYEERDEGVHVFPFKGPNLVAFAQKNNSRWLGLVMLNEGSGYCDDFNEDSVPPNDREFAKKVFEIHAHFWFCYLPWLAEIQSGRRGGPEGDLS